MYIKNRPVSALYKLFIGVVALVGFWASLLSFGASAWRLFSTYVLLVTTVYLFISALVIAVSKNRNPGRIPCPMLEGMIIVSMTLLCVATVVCRLHNVIIPGASGWHASLIYFVLPFLVFSDWAIFSRKGRWHLIDPCYWLAPAAIYASLILLTADALPDDSVFRYPVPFLNYMSQGVINMLEWFVVIGVLTLLYGYALVVIDFIASGKLSRYIVMPHLKAVDDEEEDEQPVVTEPVIERIEVKIEPMMPPKAKTQKPRTKVQDIKPASSAQKSQKPQGAGSKKRKAQPGNNSRRAGATRSTDGFKAAEPKSQQTSQKLRSEKSTPKPKAETKEEDTKIKVERKDSKKPQPKSSKVEPAVEAPQPESVAEARTSETPAEAPKVHKIRKF